jgi:hypothetical protein
MLLLSVITSTIKLLLIEMKEEYLHYIFKTKQLGKYFKTTNGEKLEVINFGYHNHSSGPDFLECQLKLNDQIWAGQIEFHLKSSDWFKHNHQTDSNYNNVIAHFVYEHDAEIESGLYQLPTIELKDFINKNHFKKYSNYINSKKWVACQNEIGCIDDFIIYQQKEKAVFNRLLRKSQDVVELLDENNGDQEKIFYHLLFKTFGSKFNQRPFEQLASKFDVKIISKLNSDIFKTQAYLFGLAGFLNDTSVDDDSYFRELQLEYQYLKKLFSLSEMNRDEWKFAAVRPHNYPTVRLAQLVHVLIKASDLRKSIDIDEIINRLTINLDDYWKRHYMFGRVGKRMNPNLTTSFIDLILINVYVLFYFSIGVFQANETLKDLALDWLEKVASEKNGIITKWKEYGVNCKSAFDSQALIELKNEFCDKNQCLNCKIGQKLLKTY